MVASDGSDSGNTMLTSVRAGPAPSMRADSSIASGSPSKNVFMMNRLYCESTSGMIWHHSVLSRLSARIRMYTEIMPP